MPLRKKRKHEKRRERDNLQFYLGASLDTQDERIGVLVLSTRLTAQGKEDISQMRIPVATAPIRP